MKSFDEERTYINICGSLALTLSHSLSHSLLLWNVYVCVFICSRANQRRGIVRIASNSYIAFLSSFITKPCTWFPFGSFCRTISAPFKVSDRMWGPRRERKMCVWEVGVWSSGRTNGDWCVWGCVGVGRGCVWCSFCFNLWLPWGTARGRGNSGRWTASQDVCLVCWPRRLSVVSFACISSHCMCFITWSSSCTCINTHTHQHIRMQPICIAHILCTNIHTHTRAIIYIYDIYEVYENCLSFWCSSDSRGQCRSCVLRGLNNAFAIAAIVSSSSSLSPLTLLPFSIHTQSHKHSLTHTLTIP